MYFFILGITTYLAGNEKMGMFYRFLVFEMK